MEVITQILESLQNGEPDQVLQLTKQAIDDGIDLKTIIDQGLIGGMSVVGQKFKEHEIFLPDVLLAAKAMYAGMEVLKPLMIENDISSIGKIVIGTVHGDLHDIGKNLVGIMLRGAGFDVIDLGSNVPADKFIDKAIETNADMIGLSALLTTTMPVMKDVVDLAKEKGILGNIKIIIGGAPLSADYAAEIGAHAYCFDGINAVECAKRLIETK